MKIKQKHEFEVCTIMYKIWRGFYPDWLFNGTFNTVEDVTNNVTRQNDKLCVCRASGHIAVSGVCMAVLGAKLWQDLPACVARAQSPSSFKSALKKLLLANNVYFVLLLLIAYFYVIILFPVCLSYMYFMSVLFYYFTPWLYYFTFPDECMMYT